MSKGSAAMAAFMMDAEYRWFQDCDEAYMRERRSAVIPGASIVAERKTAANTLLEWKAIYEQQVGIVFDWPREAVEHARAHYLGGVKS